MNNDDVFCAECGKQSTAPKTVTNVGTTKTVASISTSKTATDIASPTVLSTGQTRITKAQSEKLSEAEKKIIPKLKKDEDFILYDNERNLFFMQRDNWSRIEVIKPSDVTRYSGKKVWWKCTKGHEWKCSVVSRTKGNGCPICSESKGEKQIRKWLENNQIKFEPQKEFDGLLGLGGGNLSYDFYLPNQNLLIEYQGEFHDGSGGKYTSIKIAKQREHDKRKCEYAKQKNIDLLEIWYYDFDNIESILLNNLI
jgi:hypothetical protein